MSKIVKIKKIFKIDFREDLEFGISDLEIGISDLEFEMTDLVLLN